MSVREIQGYLQELYEVTVSPDLISQVTDGVIEEVKDRQNRPLERIYPVVFFDALRVKIRDEGIVKNKGTSEQVTVIVVEVVVGKQDGGNDESDKFWGRGVRR